MASAEASPSPPMRMDSQGNTVKVVAIVFGVITFVVIALRLISRGLIIRHIGPDDSKSGAPSLGRDS